MYEKLRDSIGLLEQELNFPLDQSLKLSIEKSIGLQKEVLELLESK